MKRILVVGGLHGNEPLGIKLVQHLTNHPCPGVTALLGNPRAVQSNVRYIEEDINRIFPGNPSGTYEQRRAHELREIGKNFDIVLDFHNTHCPDNDCSFIGLQSDETLIRVSVQLQLTRVIVADYACINQALTNCLSIEISNGSALDSVGEWVEKITALTTDNLHHNHQTAERFTFVGRVSQDDYEQHQLSNWKPFVPIPSQDALALGYSETIYPIFVNSQYVAGQYAALVRPMIQE